MLQRIIDNLDKILEIFNVEYSERGNYYKGPCSIHKGDNRGALVIYKETGGWRCYTHGCHDEYGASVVGLVRALLSAQKGAKVCYRDAIVFVENLFEGKLEHISPQINHHFLDIMIKESLKTLLKTIYILLL